MDITDFEMDVLYNVMLGTTTPKVIDSRGHTPLIACLESETVGTLLERIERAGGCGTIYALSETGEVAILAAQNDDQDEPEAVTPGKNATIRELINYISTQEDGVCLTGVKMRYYGIADLAKAYRKCFWGTG